MTDTMRNRDMENPIAPACVIPLPKGDEPLVQLATRYAHAFSNALKEQQVVVLCNVSAPVAQAVTLGAWMGGFPVAFLNSTLTKAQLDHALLQLGPTLNIGRPDSLLRSKEGPVWLNPDAEGSNNHCLSDWLQQHFSAEPIIPHEWRDDDCAAVIFTSGSTGMPKGVCHSIGNLTRSAHLFIQQFSIDSQDRLFNLAPLHTMSGIRGSVLVPLLAGCQLMETLQEVDLENVLDLFLSERPTVFICGPNIFRQLALLADKLKDEFSSIRVFLSTGAKLDRRSRVRIWESHRIPVLDYYGLTETSGLIISENPDHFDPELTSIGKECSGVTVDLTEVKGFYEKEMTAGQLRIYSPNLFLGYLGEALLRKRFFDTGDLAVRDAAGNIYLKGRLDQGVKASSTLWLFPQGVEQLLIDRPDVVDASVRSGYDKYGRGTLLAKVVPRHPETIGDDWLATLGRNIVDQLGPDYNAVDFEIASAIPRTALGKIIKDTG